MVILENIDIDKAILQNIAIDKISNRFKFGISNRASENANLDFVADANHCVDAADQKNVKFVTFTMFGSKCTIQFIIHL